MLDIQIKECCRKCNYIEIGHSAMESRMATNREPVTHVKVFCKHASVCKAYLESDEPWQGTKSRT